MDLFDVDTVKDNCDNGQTVNLLKRVGEHVDVVLLWLDNDREGENISFEILYAIHKKMSKRNFR